MGRTIKKEYKSFLLKIPAPVAKMLEEKSQEVGLSKTTIVNAGLVAYLSGSLTRNEVIMQKVEGIVDGIEKVKKEIKQVKKQPKKTYVAPVIQEIKADVPEDLLEGL